MRPVILTVGYESLKARFAEGLDVGADLCQEIFRFLRRGECVELVFLAYLWRLPCRIDERLEEKRRRLDLMLLKAALSYARRSIPVFPCQPGGKRPLTYNGFWEATTDARRIKAWWGQWPSANIGVPTGQKSGLLVLDIDSRGGGPESLAILEGQNGPLPDTARSRTGGGGVHVFFRYPAEEEVRNSAGWLGPGLDVRGEGGYVVVPPSSTQRAYEWLDRSPLAGAVWLLECLSENDEKTLF